MKSYIVLIIVCVSLYGCGGGGGSSNSSAATNSNTETNSSPPTNSNNETNSGSNSTSVPDLPGEEQVLTRCESPDELERLMLERINAERTQGRMCGNQSFPAVSPLTWNAQLVSAADAHSTDMARFNFFSHTGSNGLDVGSRVTATGYTYSAVGENIAAGQQTIDAVMAGWLDSPGHCRNIMNANYAEVGASCTRNNAADFRIYWTQVFGRARN